MLEKLQTLDPRMLEQALTARVPFGPANDPGACAPWPQPVSAFNLSWLKGVFVIDQRDRLAKVTSAIASANGEVDKLRAAFTFTKPAGLRAPNGNVLLTGEDHAAARTIRTHAQNQLVHTITLLREPLDKVITPIIRDMARASFTCDTLRARVFNKESCLSRASLTGLDRAGFAALKANYATMLEPIELFAYAQRCLDDGSAESLPLLDSIRLENFRRKKDDRAFLNGKLLSLANIPEYNEAGPLLYEVQNASEQAQLLRAQFNGDTSRASLMKMSLGLGKLSTADPQNPYADH